MDTTAQSDQPIGMPQQPLENQSPLPPQNGRKLNWKGFFIGIIAVVIIETFAVNMLQSENKQKAVISPTPVPAAQKVTPDATAKWKTYVNENFHVSFKYPSDWQVRKGEDPSSIYLEPIKNDHPPGLPTDITAGPYTYKGNLEMYIHDPYTHQSDIEKVTNKDIPNPFYKITQYTLKIKPGHYPILGAQYIIIVIENGNEKFAFSDPYGFYETPLSQILTTFKFTDLPVGITPAIISCRPRPACLDARPRCMIAVTNDMCPPPTPTPPQTACAQDAKQCPDGSYVSRIGPHCEFAACPK